MSNSANGKATVIDVKVGELKEDVQQASAPAKEKPALPPTETVKALGLSLADLTPELRDRYGLADDAAGVVNGLGGVAANHFRSPGDGSHGEAQRRQARAR